MDPLNTLSDPDASMDPSVDPRVNRPPMSLEAGPSRCHMETSFYNILHSSGFAEWAARAEEQNERLRTGTWTQKNMSGSSPSADSKYSVESSSSATAATAATTTIARPAYRLPKRATRSRKVKEAEGKPSKTRLTRSKRGGVVDEEEEQEGEEEDRNDSCPAETFVARYSNYSSMDTELNILTKHLMQHGGC